MPTDDATSRLRLRVRALERASTLWSENHVRDLRVLGFAMKLSDRGRALQQLSLIHI